MSKKEIFEAHPKLDCYFETSDGSCFYTENAAEAHAKTQKDKKVKKVYNEGSAKEDSSGAAPDDIKVLKLKQLQETELVKENYITMKELVKYFEVQVTDQKAETLIEALTAYKLKVQE